MTFLHNTDNIIALHIRRLDTGEELQLKGRPAWAIDQLLASNGHGITSLENPAPRLGHYIYCLRKLGLPIETVDESHGGPYRGSHARYHLRCDVEVLGQRFAGEAAA